MAMSNLGDDRAAAATAALSRRAVLSGAGTAVIASAIPAASSSGAVMGAVGGGSLFDVPDAAYVRRLGVVPGGLCNAAVPECGDGKPNAMFRRLAGGLSVPGLGIPLGGIGAGSFMINQCGSFGPWNMGGEPTASNWEQRILPQAAFYLREEAADGTATVTTLAVPHHNIAPQRNFGSVLPAWRQLAPGQGRYAALYPFGWIDYDGLAARAALRFWSPIVARDDRPTSMPLAYFDLILSNPTARPMKLAAMFTFPNAAPFLASRREGFYSRHEADAANRIHAVTLGADAPGNSPDSHASEWTIAVIGDAGQALSHVTSWNGGGDGGDIHRAFAGDGSLPGGLLDATHSAGAVAASLTLAPGQRATVHFVLAWDFPQTYFGADPAARAVWMRRYTEFLGGRRDGANRYVPGSYPFRQGYAIARAALVDHARNLAAVERWWRPIATGRAWPAWLRGAALNELYHTVFNTAFWEAGLVDSTIAPAGPGPRPGSTDPTQHLAFIMDSGSGGTTTNEIDADSYGYLVWARLFPAQEKGRIPPVLDAIAQDRWGRAAKAIRPEAGPFIGREQIEAGPPAQGTPPPRGTRELTERSGDAFRDCPHKVIYRAYALWRETGDDEVVRRGYAPMLKTLRYAQFFRPAGSHLPLDPPSASPANTYDQMPIDGHGVYDSQLYLLSLQAMVALTPAARRLGVGEATDAVQAELTGDLALAKAEFERAFWNPATGRYRYCDGTGGITGMTAPIPQSSNHLQKPVMLPDSVFVSAFYAQAIAMQLGLPDLVDVGRARRHLNGVMPAYLALRDLAGRPTGAPCLLDERLRPWPTSSNFTELSEVWTGSNYMLAAAAIGIGRRTGDRALVTQGMRLAEIIAERTYGDPNDGFAFATQECWFVDVPDLYRYPAYTRSRAVWQVVDALAPIPLPRV